MNAYWCTLPIRVPIYFGGMEPPEPCYPFGIYVSETRGRAKMMLLADYSAHTDPEEFLDVRTRLLQRDVVDAPAGSIEQLPPRSDDPDPEHPWWRLWLRVHEIEDHGGADCNCPEIEDEDI